MTENQQEGLRHVKARKAEALARIWHVLNEPDSSSNQQPESSASSARHPRADPARGIRLLVEEMQRDPEVADALRADLAASLRKVALAQVQSTMSSHSPDEAQQQRLFGTDQYAEAPDQASRSTWLQDAVRSLQGEESDLTSRLQAAEDILHTLQRSHLKAAVVLCVTSPDRPPGGNAIVHDSVDVADSLAKLREAARELSRSVEMRRGRTHEVTGWVDATREFSSGTAKLRQATHELSHCTAKLRIEVQRLVENHLADDQNKSYGGFFLSLGEMLDLRPRLQYSDFDPGLQSAFGMTGDFLTRSLLSVWQSSQEQSVGYDSVMVD